MRRGFARLGLAASFAALTAAPLWAQQAQPKPDNTAVNKVQREAGQPTADQQANNSSDLALTRDIRKAIVGDKTLSTYAHNVKIIAQQGQVTLKGPVRSEAEKASIEAQAMKVAGAGHVKNELSIVPAKAQSKG